MKALGKTMVALGMMGAGAGITYLMTNKKAMKKATELIENLTCDYKMNGKCD